MYRLQPLYIVFEELWGNAAEFFPFNLEGKYSLVGLDV